MTLDISNHSYIVQREKDAAFIARFSNKEAAAYHVIQQKESCVIVTRGGTFDLFDCRRILDAKKAQPA